MRIVFLDFDGVLNWRAHVEATANPTMPGPDHLVESAVRRVERFCIDMHAAIVVTSTWRLTFDQPTLEAMLRAKGLATTAVLDVAPLIPFKRGRGQEIQSWLDTVPRTRGWNVEGLVILDDQADMLQLMPWLVLSSFETGFTDAHVLEAKRILAGPGPQK